MQKLVKNQKRGKRNRQRGAELQREVVILAKKYNLTAHNRDRGGAQHEKGDVQILKKYWGCKRRKKIARWLYSEKEEVGVFFREDRGRVLVSIDAEDLLKLISRYKELIAEIKTLGQS